MDTTHLASLATFRAMAYGAFGRRRDALFELCDTLLTTGSVPALPLLSVQAHYQRRWGSLYDALAVGEISSRPLEQLLADHPLAGGEPIYAVDVSVWPRCAAETSPGRALYSHASRHAAGQPIVAGWAYSWIAQLGFARESWTAPLRVQRLRPQENSNLLAAQQITAFLPQLPPEGALPWFVFDAGYDPVQLTQALGQTPVGILVRLRAGRCFYADPTAQPPTGRPRRHGHKFACDPPQTWPTPDGDLTVEDEQYGVVRVRAWAQLHPKPQGEHAQRDARGRPQVCAARCCSSRSAACPSGPASPRRSGSGGMVHQTLRSPTWIAPGAPTCGASMWSTLSASSSRRSIGPSRGSGTPSKPTAGPGSWCWLTRSCVWLVPWWLTSDCPGNVPNQRASSRQRASSAGLRGSYPDCPSWPGRPKPADRPRDVPKASAPVARPAIPL